LISIPSKIRSTVAIALISLLAACTQPTGLVNVASSPAEDRSFETLSADTAITFDINEILLGEKYRDLFAEISTDAYERVVLLTGTVKFAQNKQRATGPCARRERCQTNRERITGHKRLRHRHRSKRSLDRNQAEGPAARDQDVRSINYRWRSVNGTVYVIGAARSQQEMDTVLDVIRKTDRVKKVINHAWVRPPKAQ
jgi:osmotically-inducible protein OsmY